MVILSLVIHVCSYQFMKYMSKPTYDPVSRSLIDSGTDLNLEQGIAE